MFRKVCLILVFSVPGLLWAQGDLLTLDAAVSELLAVNPDIQAAHYRRVAAKAAIGNAKALDDPMVGITFDDVPIQTANVKRSEEIDYRVDQKIPFPGKRYIKGKVARYEANAVAESSRGQIGDVLLDLKKTYYDLYRADRLLEVNSENQRLLKQLLGSTETRYATGQVTAESPLKAQVELSRLKNEGILLDQERITHEAHLKALLGRHSESPLALPKRLNWPHLTQDLERLKEKAAESRPELASLRESQKRERARLTEARQTFLPDLSLGLQYGQRPTVSDVWSGTASINLPIFFWGKNRARIQEAKASLKAAQAESESMTIHTDHEIEQGYSAVKSTEQVVHNYERDLLPQAKTNLEAARLAYASGKVDFMTLIDAARTYKELQTSYYESQARLGMTYATLERLVGAELNLSKENDDE